MRVAIMQPYFFPYIGYFQLVNAVDKFIFYDDVNFIKGGWINRNRVLINGQSKYLTLNLKGASSNILINEIEIIDKRDKILRSIYMAYKKAPYFESVYPLVEDIIKGDSFKISDIAMDSVKGVSEYFGLATDFEVSSSEYGESAHLSAEGRILEICKTIGAKEYLNPIGGTDLYSKDAFKEEGISLYFLEPVLRPYEQIGTGEFVQGLSIIDLLMNCSRERSLEFINNERLI